MKRIGFFYPPINDAHGGSIRMNAIRNFLSNDLELEVVDFKLDMVKYNDHYLNLYNVHSLIKKMICKNKISLFNEHIWNSRVIELKKFLQSITQRYSNSISKIDIIHGESWFAGMVCMQLKKCYEIPFVYDARGIEGYEISNRGANKRGINFYKKVEKEILITADWIIAVSDIMKECFVKEYGISKSKIVVISNGANLVENNKAIYRLPFKIIYGGNFAYYERVIDFVKTAEILAEDDFKFILMGDGALRNEIFDYINKNNVNIIYVGRKDKSKSLNQFLDSQIGVAPVLKDLRSAASSSLKLFHYASCGLPIVTVNVGNWGEIITKYDCGIVVENSDPKEFADAIRQLMNRKVWERKSENSRKMILEAYNWTKLLYPLSEIYRSLQLL